MTYNTLGLVLKYQNYREVDRIYTIYTQDFGKLILLARGSNKIKSKLAGHLEPGCLSWLMIAQGKQFEILAQARTLISFVNLRQDSQKFGIALILLESLDKLTGDQQAEPSVFALLLRGLKRIEEWSLVSLRSEAWSLIYHYFLHLLIYLGHAPDLRHGAVLKDLLIASTSDNDIIISERARGLISQYLLRALDEKRLNSLQFLIPNF